ncbi:putative harbinger transposase-derived nuclease domain-containing protein [Helianthus annuus]|uniref:protein ANTAGONIST OF LIKE HETEROCHROMATIN PROTEIN 1-like n=1 Tax=Helianthus annuus TaxID=4232 RepID=UPI000B8FE929|nr:protein ANTAGONIST OF LIKE HETEROCHROMATIN PROTEIN 1-like [Helianthus annuus]KAJ0531898.1 putative harbinger transposase-derived nuclease domain-containing protein [Helianthus annuus]KAJ0885921.1 putative harbinger transposase-derived nuclease domain-containing protein [Helianthus annuus]
MEITSVPFLNPEEYSLFCSFFQDFDNDGETSVNKRRKIDEKNKSLSEILEVLDETEIPTSKFEIPSSEFENRASEMGDWEQGRVRKGRNQSPATFHGGETAEDGGQRRRLWVKERSKGWWKYLDSDECSDGEFRKAFRMSKGTFNMICDELESVVMKKNTMLRKAIPARQRVAVCIYRLATGDPLRTVSSLFGLGISTCHKLVLEVCAAIRSVLMPKYLQWPDQERLQEIKTTFGSISGIPNVNGSIYTTHVSIIAPKTNQESYYNRKHTERNQKPSYSTTVQGLVDPRGVFTDVCIGYPGSLSDEQILEKSALSQRSKLGMLENTWVVGNSGYYLKDWVLVPYTHQNLSWSQHAFNQRLDELQMIAKDAFMRLKGRWGCLQKRTEVKLQELPMVLGACCVLHNICEMHNEEMDVELRFNLYDDEMELDGSRGISVNALQARDGIAHSLMHCK